MKMFKTKTGAGVSTNSEPAEVKIVPDDKGMISTNNIEAVMRRRKAEADGTWIPPDDKGTIPTNHIEGEKIGPNFEGPISTNNIEAVRRRRAADAEAAKIEAEKKAAQNEKA